MFLAAIVARQSGTFLLDQLIYSSMFGKISLLCPNFASKRKCVQCILRICSTNCASIGYSYSQPTTALFWRCLSISIFEEIMMLARENVVVIAFLCSVCIYWLELWAACLATTALTLRIPYL